MCFLGGGLRHPAWQGQPASVFARILFRSSPSTLGIERSAWSIRMLGAMSAFHDCLLCDISAHAQRMHADRMEGMATAQLHCASVTACAPQHVVVHSDLPGRASMVTGLSARGAASACSASETHRLIAEWQSSTRYFNECLSHRATLEATCLVNAPNVCTADVFRLNTYRTS